MFLIRCTDNEIAKAHESTADALLVLQGHYLLFGLPTDLSAADQQSLQGSIRVLYSSLLNAPPAGMSSLQVTAVVGTLKMMYLDAGGNPLDLLN